MPTLYVVIEPVAAAPREPRLNPYRTSEVTSKSERKGREADLLPRHPHHDHFSWIARHHQMDLLRSLNVLLGEKKKGGCKPIRSGPKRDAQLLPHIHQRKGSQTDPGRAA